VVYQVLGKNAEGETDFSAVAPDPLDPMMANIHRAFRTDHKSPLTDPAPAASEVGTHGKGMGREGNVNPRKLFHTYEQKSFWNHETSADLATAHKDKITNITHGNYETVKDENYKRIQETGGPYSIDPFFNDPLTAAPIQTVDVWKDDLEWDAHGYSLGMPFYIKDLRDGNYIVFRAYVDGIDETITPGWESENYIGRSEPVYTYGPTERDISINLKLFAQTENELDLIYQKLNRLTSLCYPEYAKDVRMGDKTRMKPPIIQFRLGELFGSGTRDMTGFIKTLTYTFEDDSPWETAEGYRVPKYITAALGFQVIHEEVPSLDFSRHADHDQASNFRFYGINDTIGTGVMAE
jgi:hypothetical protein